MKKLAVACFLAALPLLAAAQQPASPATYWQQEVKYSIDVALDDQKHELAGREELTYTNNSPQALSFIWFHLWPNAYRDTHTAWAQQQLRNGHRKFQFAPAADHGFIDGLDFKVNGQVATLEYDPANPDVAKLMLPQPLAAGASATISTPFHVKLPASFSRLGHVGQSYQITQWYPKPAVYDRKGWHQMPYLDMGEFYSEFGSFDVTITLPANYTVGATGELQNPDEQARMAAMAEATALKKTKADFGSDLSFPASAPTTKTLRYKQDRVHDFAWFADKRFNVLKSSVTLASGRPVSSWVLFTNKEPLKWVKGLQDLNDALTSYSKWVGEYPYSAATAVDGVMSAGAGMEYPMVTVTMPSAIVHEVGHNWFYGILGSNERDFPWMDEGVNTYNQLRLEERSNPQASVLGDVSLPPRLNKALGLDKLPGSALNMVMNQALTSRGLAQPVQGLSTAAYSQVNYAGTVYAKTATLFKYLAGYLGQDKFDQAMQAYYAQWQFKHPYPEDMQAVFERSTSRKLGWFFKDMLTTTQPYNADISHILVFNDTVKVLVRTDSERPWAVPVSTVDAQGNILETRWTPPFGVTDPDPEEDAESQLNFGRANVAAIVVDAGYVAPQLNRRDDRLKLSGSLPRAEPLRLRPLLSVERWDKATISWLPVLGANTSDKFMLGAAFYNNPLTPKRLQYLAMPMYAFGSKELNGIASLQLNVLPASLARRIITGISVQRFERYLKLEPSLTFVLPRRGIDVPQHQLQLALTSVQDEDRDLTSSIQTVDYHVYFGNALHRWDAQLELTNLLGDDTDSRGSGEALLLRATAGYQRHYAEKKKVTLRLFGGRFLSNASQSQFVLGLSGSPDYRRQTAFLDRQQISPTFAAQRHQTDNRDGAFKAFLPVYSQRWLSTLNVQADVPRLPLAVFADLGYASVDELNDPGIDPAANRKNRTYYDAGLVLPLFGETLQFYLPVAGSQYENGLPSSRQDFTDRIRFVLRLNQLNPFKQLDEQLMR